MIIVILCLSLRENYPYSALFWSAFFRIRTESGKIRTRKTPNMDTFHAVSGVDIINIFASWGLYKNHKKQHFLWSILSDLRRGIARIPQISKIESFVTIAKRLKVVNYCCKTLHLRCLQGFLATPLLRLTARINRSEWVSCCQYANRNILTK